MNVPSAEFPLKSIMHNNSNNKNNDDDINNMNTNYIDDIGKSKIDEGKGEETGGQESEGGNSNNNNNNNNGDNDVYASILTEINKVNTEDVDELLLSSVAEAESANGFLNLNMNLNMNGAELVDSTKSKLELMVKAKAKANAIEYTNENLHSNIDTDSISNENSKSFQISKLSNINNNIIGLEQQDSKICAINDMNSTTCTTTGNYDDNNKTKHGIGMDKNNNNNNDNVDIDNSGQLTQLSSSMINNQHQQSQDNDQIIMSSINNPNKQLQDDDINDDNPRNTFDDNEMELENEIERDFHNLSIAEAGMKFQTTQTKDNHCGPVDDHYDLNVNTNHYNGDLDNDYDYDNDNLPTLQKIQTTTTTATSTATEVTSETDVDVPATDEGTEVVLDTFESSSSPEPTSSSHIITKNDTNNENVSKDKKIIHRSKEIVDCNNNDNVGIQNNDDSINRKDNDDDGGGGDNDEERSHSESTISTTPSLYNSNTFQISHNKTQQEEEEGFQHNQQPQDHKVSNLDKEMREGRVTTTNISTNYDDEGHIINTNHDLNITNDNDLSYDESVSSTNIRHLKKHYESLLSRQRQEHTKQIDDILIQLSSIESTYQDEIMKFQNDHSKKELMCDALTTSLSDYKRRNMTLEKEIESCTLACSELECKLEDAAAQLQEANREIFALRQHYDALRISSEKEKQDAISFAQREIQSQAETQFAVAQKKYIQLKNSHQQNLQEREILEEQLSTLKKQIENKERVHENHISQVKEELNVVRLELSSSKVENQKVKSMLNERMAQLESREKDLDEQLESKSKEYQSLVREKHKLKQENMELQSLCEELMSMVERGVDSGGGSGNNGLSHNTGGTIAYHINHHQGHTSPSGASGSSSRSGSRSSMGRAHSSHISGGPSLSYE